MEDFSSTGQLVTFGLVNSTVGAMAEGLALVETEVSISKVLLCSNLTGHYYSAPGTRPPSWSDDQLLGVGLNAHAHQCYQNAQSCKILPFTVMFTMLHNTCGNRISNRTDLVVFFEVFRLNGRVKEMHVAGLW